MSFCWVIAMYIKNCTVVWYIKIMYDCLHSYLAAKKVQKTGHRIYHLGSRLSSLGDEFYAPFAKISKCTFYGPPNNALSSCNFPSIEFLSDSCSAYSGPHLDLRSLSVSQLRHYRLRAQFNNCILAINLTHEKYIINDLKLET